MWWGILSVLLVVATLPHESPAQLNSAGATVDTTAQGYFKVNAPARIDSLYVIVDQNFDSPYYIANGDTLALEPGTRYITLAMKRTPDHSFPATIQADTVISVRSALLPEDDRTTYLEKSSYPVLHHDVNLVVVTDRDAQIDIDEKPRGTGVARLRVSQGRHLIETSHPKAGHTERVVAVQTDPPRLSRVTMYNKPNRVIALSLSPVPGLSQLYKQHEVKGLSLIVGFIATSIGGVQQSGVFEKRHREYQRTRELYEEAETEEQALQLGNKTDRLYREARRAYWRRNVLIGAATGLCLYSLFDAWLNQPAGGYRTPISRRARVEPLLGTQRQGFRFVIQL